MTIEETLKIQIHEIQEDYPDQAAESLVQHVEQGLVSFIGHVAQTYTASEAEAKVVEFDVAMKLLERFQGRTHSDLLRERLMSRPPRVSHEDDVKVVPAPPVNPASTSFINCDDCGRATVVVLALPPAAAAYPSGIVCPECFTHTMHRSPLPEELEVVPQ